MKEDFDKTFKEIYEQQSDDIFRFCLFRVSSREHALDITQETFLRLWQNLGKDKEGIRNYRAFLFTIARRLVIDWYRKKKNVTSLETLMFREGEFVEYDPVDEKTRESVGLQAEGRYLLDKIDELHTTLRDPVHLSFIEGLSPGEIGEMLGISANAASVRINRGLLELKKKTGYYKGK